MLDAIGAASIDELFDEIPPELIIKELDGVPDALSELEISRLMRSRAAEDRGALCFIGAGAYDHYIPTAVWDIATRGEFYSAYTPYQAEASQGTLQTIYEYQTMITSLTGMDVSNASLATHITIRVEGRMAHVSTVLAVWFHDHWPAGEGLISSFQRSRASLSFCSFCIRIRQRK